MCVCACVSVRVCVCARARSLSLGRTHAHNHSAERPRSTQSGVEAGFGVWCGVVVVFGTHSGTGDTPGPRLLVVQGHVCMHACIYTPGPRLLAAAAHSGPPSRDAIPRTCPDRFVVERDGVNERALWVGRGRKRQGKRQQASTRDKMCTCMHSCSCLPACMHAYIHTRQHTLANMHEHVHTLPLLGST